MAKGIFIAAFEVDAPSGATFEAWMDAHALPIAPASACWVSIANPRHAVVTYELDDVDAFAAPGRPAPADGATLLWFLGDLLSETGSEASPTSRGLLLNAMSVDPAHETEFNEWYDQEHIPALSAVPGTLAARRYRARTGSPKYLALYHLESAAVQASAEWRSAANTPWTEAMRPRFRDHIRIAASSVGAAG